MQRLNCFACDMRRGNGDGTTSRTHFIMGHQCSAAMSLLGVLVVWGIPAAAVICGRSMASPNHVVRGACPLTSQPTASHGYHSMP